MPKFSFIAQHDQMDCGPACLSMIARSYGKVYSLQYLRENSYITKDGVSVLGIREAASKIGFDSESVKISLQELNTPDHFPCILHWNQNHFVVLYAIEKRLFSNEINYKIADPGFGLIKVNEERLKKSWVSDGNKGVAILLDPTQEFYSLAEPPKPKTRFKELFKYLYPYKKQMVQLFSGLFGGSLITLTFPFLAQTLVDKGVVQKDLGIIYTILIAQICLYTGSVLIEIIRNWITLYVGSRVNISIISDFLKKILKLPIRFFDTKLIGDFNQRIQDQDRIEKFLTSQSLATLFSVVNFSVFFFVLFFYSPKILGCYLILTAIAIGWSLSFFHSRKILDYQKFQSRSDNQESIYELINGIQEIKLNSVEKYKREKWENIQVKLFGINLRILKLDQLQMTGFDFINSIKNILVTFIAAKEVINANLTLGAMLSISYIIGQMNSPVNQLIAFFRALQDARISMERLNDIHHQADEEIPGQLSMSFDDNQVTNGRQKGIKIKNLSFQYEGPKSAYTLKNINLFIPEGQTTAIVGESGSGKTTLMKLLLKFYEPSQGTIHVDDHNLNDISAKSWRNNCGVVMQEGYIFSDTIERNIYTGEEEFDQAKFNQSVAIANIKSFLVSLPLRENTKIGAGGVGISGGQKQRLLIARAVYKSPKYMFFDEATSSLDADNERVIHDNLQSFFENRTVVVIAHRLSTVRNADQIIVLKDGEIVENGDHQELISLKGRYFELVKNQLELSV
ncbi:peptidase domain-containing ABC transporter [Mucilaginibacter terrae]|uniref:ATP-binding cassette subfamily B protein n=1 Tax=Mucilaginibacter terrae TaxID=1955052 RepID=A0ABU3GX11_9SPHI|nr:peptidase domain-containing ABC transporter [Mucilaginibacter terrae]MDT3404310.1 ATP-binding cassette subfamily B protein [Mucilaginibacter terrae]